MNLTSILLNKLLPSQKRKKERNQETKQMAIQLAKLFGQRGFKTKEEIDLYDNNQEKITDIDCLAYKDGVLFFIELKSTYFRATLKEVLDNGIAMKKAGEQLQKVENYLKSHPDFLKNTLGIDKSIDEVQLYPLIVSTSFENDYETFNGYRKISLFELNIILNNEKMLLFLTSTHAQKLIKKHKVDLSINDLTKTKENIDELVLNKVKAFLEKINPYENSFYPVDNDCSPKYIIEAIEQDKVWSFLDDEPYPKYSYVQYILPLNDYASKQYNNHYSIFQAALDAQYKENDTLKSMRLVEQALELYPNDDEYLVLRGDNHARLGNTLKSIMDLKKAVEINPQNETAHSNLALSYFEMLSI